MKDSRKHFLQSSFYAYVFRLWGNETSWKFPSSVLKNEIYLCRDPLRKHFFGRKNFCWFLKLSKLVGSFCQTFSIWSSNLQLTSPEEHFGECFLRRSFQLFLQFRSSSKRNRNRKRKIPVELSKLHLTCAKVNSFGIWFEIFGNLADTLRQGCENRLFVVQKNLWKNLYIIEKIVFFIILEHMALFSGGSWNCKHLWRFRKHLSSPLVKTSMQCCQKWILRVQTTLLRKNNVSEKKHFYRFFRILNNCFPDLRPTIAPAFFSSLKSKYPENFLDENCFQGIIIKVSSFSESEREHFRNKCG